MPYRLLCPKRGRVCHVGNYGRTNPALPLLHALLLVKLLIVLVLVVGAGMGVIAMVMMMLTIMMLTR